MPNKQFLIAPTGGAGAGCKSCANCPWMAMNNLDNLASSITQVANEIFVEPQLAQQALTPLQRMLDFVKTQD